MKSPLDRILRLRTLLEDSGRTELERRAQLLRGLEATQRAELDSSAGERKRAFESVAAPGAGHEQAPSTWREAHAAGGYAAQRAARLFPAIAAAEQRTAAAREAYLERRKEKRQVATVLEQKQAELQYERARREQAMLDDWFSMRRR
ncbi:flagellar FliJ family protein [Silvibacterium acidisoli]|uniref:flagellar FliJ family protein n=1 Tax=Acidobacteriaceae bacterium ZG23-2 TaxID=2883246 RepID=UPI00406C7C08